MSLSKITRAREKSKNWRNKNIYFHCKLFGTFWYPNWSWMSIQKSVKQYITVPKLHTLKIFLVMYLYAANTLDNLGCSWNKQTKFLVCFGGSNLYRNNRKKQNCFKRTEETEKTGNTINFLQKNSKICSLSNCLGWSFVCFGSIEISKLSVSV